MLVDESERFTVLKLPYPSTLLSLFQKNEPIILQHIEGEDNIIELIYGYQSQFGKRKTKLQGKIKAKINLLH